MPELRRDPLTRRWVIVAAERAKRPHDFARQSRSKSTGAGACPFCPGNEAQTPPEVLAYRPEGGAANTSGWQLRVVPNMYPALGPEEGVITPREDGVYLTLPGLGAHEVIVVSPVHEPEVARIPVEQLTLMAHAFADRYREHSANPLIAYIHVIMNYGREAGASRDHPHAQLLGLPLVPSLIESELAAAEDYYAAHGRCLVCDCLRQELAGEQRVIWQDERFVLFAPYASRVPFEIWLAPKQHSPRFELADEGQLESFAAGLHEAFGRLYSGLHDPPFNFWMHTAPTRRDAGPFYHWHLELQPKLSIAAGFELGMDVTINTMPPESAAAHLRAAKVGGS